jgi:hypothetical protein
MTGKLESIKEAMGHALAIDNFDLRVDGNGAFGDSNRHLCWLVMFLAMTVRSLGSEKARPKLLSARRFTN